MERRKAAMTLAAHRYPEARPIRPPRSTVARGSRRAGSSAPAERTGRLLVLALSLLSLILTLLPLAAVTAAAQSTTRSMSGALPPDTPDAGASTALDIVFVLDNSGSMRAHDPGFLTRAAVADFVAALAGDPKLDARLGVVLFDAGARLVQALASIDTPSSRSDLRQHLAALDFSGQRTNTAAGIERALYELQQSGREHARRTIILLSDGRIDTGSRQKDLEASRWLREDLARQGLADGVRIFGIAFSENADYQLMQALALETGAGYYRAIEASDLAEVVATVLRRVGDRDGLAAIARDTTAIEPSPVTPRSTPLPPAVAAAPERADGGSQSRLLGLLPIALLPIALVLLVASIARWQLRRRPSPPAEVRPTLELQKEAGAPTAQLLDLGGQLGEPGSALPLNAGLTRLGRDRHNDLMLDDDTVSSEHALIELREGRYWLEDRRSTNGTHLANERLLPGRAVELKGGDHVRFAEIDLMFVLSGYVPGGDTVLLSSTTRPPFAPPPPSEASDMPAEPEPEDPISGLPDSRIDPHRECLDRHLDRVAALSPAFAAFVARAFSEEIRGALSVAARDLLQEAQRSDGLVRRAYPHETIRFVICAIPGDLGTARDHFQSAVGGFTRLLTEELESDSFRLDRCEILAVLTFGGDSEAWASLSIVPEEGQDPQLELLSFELLTEQERSELASPVQAHSGSGIA